MGSCFRPTDPGSSHDLTEVVLDMFTIVDATLKATEDACGDLIRSIMVKTARLTTNFANFASELCCKRHN